ILTAQGDSARARELLTQLLASNPDFASAWQLDAGLKMTAGEFAAGRESLRRAQEHARVLPMPQQLLLAGALVEADLSLNDTERAAQDLQALSSRVPRAPLTLSLSARLALLRNDNASAITDLQQLLQMSPDNLQAQLLLAIAQTNSGNIEQAQQGLERVLAR